MKEQTKRDKDSNISFYDRGMNKWEVRSTEICIYTKKYRQRRKEILEQVKKSKRR